MLDIEAIQQAINWSGDCSGWIPDDVWLPETMRRRTLVSRQLAGSGTGTR